MKISQLRMKNFTVFSDVVFDFCPGVNVLIGANGSGKTHVMKALYSLLKASESNHSKSKEIPYIYDIAEVFRCEGGNRRHLVRKPLKNGKTAELIIKSGRKEFALKIEAGEFHGVLKDFQTVFIPSSDVLAIYEGFMASYEMRELAFDRTYYDLCKALSANPLKSFNLARKKLIEEIEKTIGGEIMKKADRFYLKSKAAMFEAHLLAEGHRKLAMIAYLIKNGAIGESTVIFWDEPEVNLNPVLITKAALMIRELAMRGAQIFIATHDYLLTGELSMAAEFKIAPKAPIRFFALSKNDLDAPTQIETGNVLADLQENLIVKEFAAHYDREQEIFRKSLK